MPQEMYERVEYLITVNEGNKPSELTIRRILAALLEFGDTSPEEITYRKIQLADIASL